MKTFLASSAFLLAALSAASAQQPGTIPAGYTVETIAPPEGVTLGAAGLDVDAAGKVYVGTRFGQVWTYSGGDWALFAEGLHEITGLLVAKPGGEVYVMQKPELTQLIDTDNDGVADYYKTVSADWGYTGNYHEYAYGPVRDSRGNFYGTLNLGHGGGPSIQGAIMSANAPDRGTCIKVGYDGTFSTFSWGMRSPAGIGINPKNDEIFYTDNQGDWNASSSLQQVKEGRFHGHPASLAYNPDYKGKDLNQISPADYDKARSRPAMWIPHGEIANSPGNPVFNFSEGKFGPFEGQIFIGDQTKSTIFRGILDEVGGEYQGAIVMFIDHLQCGALRLAFAPDGSLWVGETARGWGSVGGAPFGLQHIVYDGKTTPFEIADVKLASDGFDISLTSPIAAIAADKVDINHWHYHYHGSYGSPKVEEKSVKASAAELSADKKTIHLKVPDLTPGEVYKISLPADLVPATATAKLTTRTLYYTLNRLKK